MDDRGNFSKTCLPEEDLAKAREFLSKIPAYESHYSRRDCGKRFVSPHLTIAALYEEYKRNLNESSSNPISYRKFCDEFHSLNLKIKKPKVDTCAKCDTLAMKIKISPEQDKEEFEKKLKDHHDDAEYAYE